MRRGGRWIAEKLKTLPRGWIVASGGPATEVDQKATRFNDTMFEKLRSLAGFHCSDNTYIERAPKSVHAKFEELPADSKNFIDALRRVDTSQPSAVNVENEIYTAISIHTGR